MGEKFKAAILVESAKDLIIDEVEMFEKIDIGQVLVRLKYSGICGAQINEINAVKGEDKFLPHLLGHEGFAEVVEVGPMVDHVKPGDDVILHWMQGTGIQSKPPKYKWKHREINAGWVTTFNELAVISANRCTKVSTKIDPRYLPLFGCAITTSYGNLAYEANAKLSDSILIIGVGGVGIFSTIFSKQIGCHPIVAIDKSDARLQKAIDFGADFGLNSNFKSKKQLIREVEDFFGSQSPEVIIEISGNKEMIELAYEVSGPNTRVILVGVPEVTKPIEIESLKLHFGMKFTGSKGGTSYPSIDIPRLISAVERNIIDIEKIPIRIVRLEEINSALSDFDKIDDSRVVIQFE